MRITLLVIAVLALVVAALSLYLLPKQQQIGAALEQSGRFDEALEYYTAALRANPLDEPTWVQLAGLYVSLGRPEEAIKVYRYLVELDPDDPGYRKALALYAEWSLDMDEAIQQHFRKRYDLAIGEGASEQIKVEVGSAYPAADATSAEVRGRELGTGTHSTVLVSAEEIREILANSVELIVRATRECLADSPPELAHDVLETGVFLTGGGVLLRGLDMRLAHGCEVPVQLAEHPLTTVVAGVGRLLDYEPDQREAFLTAHRPVP